MILVLDEVDVLIRRDSSDLIYKLLRIDEGQGNRARNYSLILVSQDPVTNGHVRASDNL